MFATLVATTWFALVVFVRRWSTVMFDLMLLILACHIKILFLGLAVVVGRRCCFNGWKSCHLLLLSLLVCRYHYKLCDYGRTRVLYYTSGLVEMR